MYSKESFVLSKSPSLWSLAKLALYLTHTLHLHLEFSVMANFLKLTSP